MLIYSFFVKKSIIDAFHMQKQKFIYYHSIVYSMTGYIVNGYIYINAFHMQNLYEYIVSLHS